MASSPATAPASGRLRAGFDRLRANGALARCWAWLPPLAYGVAIFWASSSPNPFPFAVGGLLAQDKLLHAIAFAGLGAVLVRTLGRAGVPPAAWVALATIGASAYGLVDEWHQSFVPGRSPDPKDWIADTLGALAGAAIAAAVLRRRMARATVGA
jgi:hypothetical protein